MEHGTAETKKRALPVDKKLWPFFILEVLRKHALDGAVCDDDGTRYLTRQQIVAFLEQDYGIETQIRAVGDNLVRLHEAGLDHPELGYRLEFLEGERSVAQGASASPRDRQLVRMGWRWAEESEFEPSEIRMLIDTVIASPVIPKNHARTLVRKLLPLTTEKIAVPDTTRIGYEAAQNSEFFLNVELLNEAIQQHRSVEFDLGIFGKDGKLRKADPDADDDPYKVVPVQLLISKGNYYLLAHYEDSEKIYKFRIDLMINVKIDEKTARSASGSKVDIVRFREQHAYMMSGKVIKVRLRIDKERLHTLYDQFGPHVHFSNEREDTIDAEFKTALYSILFWALQYYRSVEVLSPPELRHVLADAGKTIHEIYSGEPGEVELDEKQSADEIINGS